MQHCLFIFLLFILTTTTTFTQPPAKLTYQQDNNAVFWVQSTSDLLLRYPLANPTPLEVVTVDWHIKGQTISLSTPTTQIDSNPNVQVATFSMPVLDATLEGHLEWGKAVLEQLDSQAIDSTVTIYTSIKQPTGSILEGTLAISFRDGWKKDDEFWNRAAQYKLLHQQNWVNDSIKFWKKELLRTEALLTLNQKAWQETQNSIQLTKSNVLTFCQDTLLLDSLLHVEETLNKGLEKASKGQILSNSEKMNLAKQTTTRSQLLLTINHKKNPTCQEQLHTILKKQRNLLYLQHQRNLLNQQQLLQKKQFKTFQNLHKKSTQQLAILTTRLPK